MQRYGHVLMEAPNSVFALCWDDGMIVYYMGIKVSIVVGTLEISIPKLKSNIHLILKKESEKQE